MSETEDLKKAYLQECHRMQAGVKTMQAFKPDTLASLRIGLNVQMSSQGALMSLLLKKGLFTEREMYEEMLVYMHNEVRRLERELSIILEKPVTLATPFHNPVTGDQDAD